MRFNKTLEHATGCVDNLSYRGRAFWDVFVLPEGVAKTKRVFEEAVRGLPARDREDNWVAKGGEQVDVIWSITPLQDEFGRQRYLVTGLDVTWRKRQEDELRESEARFRDLANNAPVMIWMADPEGV